MKVVKYIVYSIGIILIFLIGYMLTTQKNMNEFALDVLSLFKSVSGNKVELMEIDNAQSKSLNHAEWTILLQKHVSDNGKVNYVTFSEDGPLLDRYLKLLSNNPPKENLSPNKKLAYWINAYNAFTVRLILDHYPINSIKEISNGLPMINSPWDIKFFKIGGVDFDLNTIEHEVLRSQFDEPRIHFAINCASVSCPILRNEAYVSNRLDEQLEQQAIMFINDKSKNSITASSVEISMIFNWFNGDFTKKGTLFDYLKQYHSDIKSENSINYLKYNWALNE